jgi:hypothetical protein
MDGEGAPGRYQDCVSANSSPATNWTAPTAMAASQLIMSVITSLRVPAVPQKR